VRSVGPEKGDVLFAELLRAGESAQKAREFLSRQQPDTVLLLALLRRAVPVRFLEAVAATPPWSSDARLLAGVALNPRAPASLVLRLLPSLFWRDLAEVARNPRLAGPVRVRAESLLKERLPDLRLGEKIALGKLATTALLPLLLAESEPKVVRACLINSRLREEDLLTAMRLDTAPRALLEEAADSSRWSERYGVKLALVLQPKTPLPIALGQISSLILRDLARVAATEGLPLLVQAAAARVAAVAAAEGPTLGRSDR